MSSNGIRPFSHDATDASSVCSDSSASSGYISSSDSCSDSEQGASFGETILDAARRAVDSNGLVPPDFQERFKKLGASASDLLELVRLSREATHYGLQRGLSSDPLASPQELLDCVQSNIAFEASMAADDDDFNLDTLSTNNHKVSFIAAALEQAAKFELECFQNPEREKIYQALYPLMDRELGAMLANPSADALYHIASSIGAEGLPLIRDLAQDITVLKDCLHTVAFASFRISLNSGNIFAATNWLASVDPASYFERLDKEINRAVSPTPEATASYTAQGIVDTLLSFVKEPGGMQKAKEFGAQFGKDMRIAVLVNKDHDTYSNAFGEALELMQKHLIGNEQPNGPTKGEQMTTIVILQTFMSGFKEATQTKG